MALAHTQTTDTAKKQHKRGKLFYKIQEVAEITELKPHVLRYWETQFAELRPEKDRNDQRRYRDADIDMVLKIRDLLYEKKFTIAGARQQLRAERRARNARPEDIGGIRNQLHELVQELSA